MRKIITSVLILLSVLTSLSHGQAAEPSWVPFQKLTYFSPENRALHQQLNTQIAVFRQLGFPEHLQEEMARDFYIKLGSRDTLRPYVSDDWVLLGINTRWVSIEPSSQNPLLKCIVAKPKECLVLATFPNNEVANPIFYSSGTVVIERETFERDVLNTGAKDFLISRDDGKTWQPFETPVPCKKLGYWCDLHFQDAQRFVLLSTNLKDDYSGFDNLDAHTSHDGGTSWERAIQKWPDVNTLSNVSLHTSTLLAPFGTQKATADFGTLNLSTKNKSVIKTDISTAQWSSTDSRLLPYQNRYLAMLEQHPLFSGHFALFRISSESTKTMQLWNSGGQRVKDLLVSESAIVIRTWNPDVMVPSVGRFHETLHYSLDSGSTWISQDIPYTMLDSQIKLSNRRVWMFLPSGIQSFNLGSAKP